jgi:hypothetical protein
MSCLAKRHFLGAAVLGVTGALAHNIFSFTKALGFENTAALS